MCRKAIAGPRGRRGASDWPAPWSGACGMSRERERRLRAGGSRTAHRRPVPEPFVSCGVQSPDPCDLPKRPPSRWLPVERGCPQRKRHERRRSRLVTRRGAACVMRSGRTLSAFTTRGACVRRDDDPDPETGPLQGCRRRRRCAQRCGRGARSRSPRSPIHAWCRFPRDAAISGFIFARACQPAKPCAMRCATASRSAGVRTPRYQADISE